MSRRPVGRSNQTDGLKTFRRVPDTRSYQSTLTWYRMYSEGDMPTLQHVWWTRLRLKIWIQPPTAMNCQLRNSLTILSCTTLESKLTADFPSGKNACANIAHASERSVKDDTVIKISSKLNALLFPPVRSVIAIFATLGNAIELPLWLALCWLLCGNILKPNTKNVGKTMI